MEMSRRDFLKQSSLGSAALLTSTQRKPATPPSLPEPTPEVPTVSLNLSPATWIWYPSSRTLPNTFLLFRRSFQVSVPVRNATGWVAADSRYQLRLNGLPLQRGPAPCDPRHLEADPLDAAKLLRTGENVLGATVLFYGHGDGTWPIGKPGFILRLDIECVDGSKLTLVTNEEWQTSLVSGWPPGMYKRWYVRALQEVFDARQHPEGWDQPGFIPDGHWLGAMKLVCSPDAPPLSSTYPDALLDARAPHEICSLRARTIPFMQEQFITPSRCSSLHRIHWRRPATEFFDVLPPDAYEAEPAGLPLPSPREPVLFTLQEGEAFALTYELEEEVVGYPSVSVDAPEGTMVELLIQEGHRQSGPVLLNTHFHAWSRFLCRQGENVFEAFDYEAVKWLQIHVHGCAGNVRVKDAGVRRRSYPWPEGPSLRTSDPKLNTLIRASVNTLVNSAQETIVDGMGRERQQYSGDCSHQLHGIYLAFGDSRLPARFIRTFSQGITVDGYFLDCWPAFDRLARVMERQLGLTPWGPILDHSIGFVFDCYYYYLYTGDLDPLREAYPRLQRFLRYLRTLPSPTDGLLPVTGLGVPSVWMDHYAYLPGHPHHKQCAFNLYAAAMLQTAFPPLATALGEDTWASESRRFAVELLDAARRAFWDPTNRLFVINRPWLSREREPRLCDRSLATAILFDQCPDHRFAECVDVLANPPENLGISYPANSCWRLWALARGRRPEAILREFHERWWTMESVHKNNTISENWKALPDSPDVWSHCAVVPLYMSYMALAGIEPLDRGWKRILLHPQPGELTEIEAAVRTPLGELKLLLSGKAGARQMTATLPESSSADLVLDTRERLPNLSRARGHLPGTSIYTLSGGRTYTFDLRYT